MLDLDTNVITCVAGPGCTFPVALAYPVDLEWGPDGRMYIVERDGNTVDALDLSTGTLETVVGNGLPCHAPVCLEPTTHTSPLEVQLNGPSGVAFDRPGNLYVTDQYNGRILRIAH